MDKGDLAEISKAVNDAVAPVLTRVEALDTRVGEVAGKVEAAEQQVKGLETQVREYRDSDGKVFIGRRGAGRVTRGGGPAYVRAAALGDRGYRLSNIVRGIAERNMACAPLEVHVHELMLRAGFQKTSSSLSYLVPLSSADEFIPDEMESAAPGLRSLLSDCLPLTDEDPYEVHRVMKAYGRGDLVGKAMDPLNDAAGGSYVPYPERGELIELLRKATVFGQAGAQQVALPPGGLDYPKESGGTTFAHRPLGSQTTIADSTPATGSVKLSPKELAGLVKIPNSLIRFSLPSVEAVVRRALASDAMIAADASYLTGGGGSTVPQGLLVYQQSANDTPTMDRVTRHDAATIAANGNTFGAGDPALMVSLVEEAPDSEGPTAWLFYPRLFWLLANRRAAAIAGGDQEGPFLFPVTRGAMSGAIMKELLNVPVITSTQVPKDRVKGSGTTLSVAVLGNFRRSVIGRVGALELAASTERGFELNETWIRAILWHDFALLHAESFVVTDTLLLA